MARVPEGVDGERLRQLRRRSGLTQMELAMRAGVSISTLYRAERSSLVVSGAAAARLATALSVVPDVIWSGQPVAVEPSPADEAADVADSRHAELIHRLDGLQDSVDDLGRSG